MPETKDAATVAVSGVQFRGAPGILEGPQSGAHSITAKKILVVDDEPMVRDMCRRLLDRMGHNTASADCGREGIRAYLEALDAGAPFDIVILDLTLPDIGGTEVLGTMRRISTNAKFILSTGYSNLSEDYSSLGFDAVLEKPFRMDMLNALISGLG